VTLIVIFLI